ncbi:site-specific integrase [Pseudomonas kurunegalensis]|uniref:site-specific integrase n=1 Tax=Pseudomonas kurunegalensis TaxID=485880 RepID=UPI002363AB58|nr:site-specific integrase [Pseudomonas kurunegalensis]MDD2134799.1 site-specific integrase [Pseudomonas kurunegalensis]
MSDNLIQKKGESTWYVRLAVPADVQKALGCKVKVQSLKTGLRKEAMEARLPYLAQWKAEIAAARAQVQNRKGNWKVEVALMGSAMEKLTHKVLQKFVKGPPTDLPAAVSAFNEKLARGHADTARKATETYGLTATEVAEAKELLRSPAAHLGTLTTKAVVAITPARLKAFREFRESRGGADKHVDQQVSKLRTLSGFLKQEDLPINFDAVDQWLKSLNRAPATLSQYLMAGTAFWKWATKYDAAWREEYKDKVNPFTGHDLPQGGGAETAGQDREIFTRDDAVKLHGAALKKKDQPLADLILLGWYTGGRIEELCKFTKDSVITVDGIPCLDFPRSKSKASKRVVPIHPSLLPTTTRLSEDSTDTFLIPVSSSGPYGKRSHAITKAFGRLKKSLGFSDLHVFHSFRHTVVTELIRADVPDALVKELAGHETGSVTHDVYSKGASAAQKLEAISKLPTLPI